MKFHIVVLFLVSAARAYPDVTCEEGWRMRGDFCYYVETNKAQFADALAACQEKGANLAILTDLEESKYVGGLAPEQQTWIGMMDVTSNNDWQWVDGSDAGWFNWNPGEPNNYQGRQEDCVNIYPKGTWNDLTCSSNCPSICKKLGEIVCLEDGIFPHPYDCTKFYVCDHLIRHDFNCPADLVFNPELQVCDYAENVPGCD